VLIARLALIRPSTYPLAKLLPVTVLLVLPTVPKPILMEHAKHAPLTTFFLMIRRLVALALIRPNIYLLAKLSLPTVLLVLPSAPNVMSMEHARLVLPTMLSLMIRRLVALVLTLPSIYLLVKPSRVNVSLVPLTARHVA